MPLPELTELCKSLAEVVTDQSFISQVLAINDDIGNMSVENWQLKEPKDVAATETETKMEEQAIKDIDNAAAT